MNLSYVNLDKLSLCLLQFMIIVTQIQYAHRLFNELNFWHPSIFWRKNKPFFWRTGILRFSTLKVRIVKKSMRVLYQPVKKMFVWKLLVFLFDYNFLIDFILDISHTLKQG